LSKQWQNRIKSFSWWYQGVGPIKIESVLDLKSVIRTGYHPDWDRSCSIWIHKDRCRNQ